MSEGFCLNVEEQLKDWTSDVGGALGSRGKGGGGGLGAEQEAVESCVGTRLRLLLLHSKSQLLMYRIKGHERGTNPTLLRSTLAPFAQLGRVSFKDQARAAQSRA